VPYKDDWTIGVDLAIGVAMAECVHAADEIFAAGLKADFRGVGVPPGFVTVQEDSGVRDHGRQHIAVFKPLDVAAWTGFMFPGPRPICVGAEAVYGDDAIEPFRTQSLGIFAQLA
jgi:hypothetical protein